MNTAVRHPLVSFTGGIHGKVFFHGVEHLNKNSHVKGGTAGKAVTADGNCADVEKQEKCGGNDNSVTGPGGKVESVFFCFYSGKQVIEDEGSEQADSKQKRDFTAGGQYPEAV